MRLHLRFIPLRLPFKMGSMRANYKFKQGSFFKAPYDFVFFQRNAEGPLLFHAQDVAMFCGRSFEASYYRGP